MTRYISGLCAAGLGLCAAGWLVVAAFAFRGAGMWDRAAVANLVTGAALAVVCVVTLTCWSVAWRRKLRADGALRTAPPAAVRSGPDGTEQLLADLRGLLAPLLTVPPAPSPRIPLDGEEAW